METFLIIIGLLFYAIIGMGGFIFWWTKDYDLTTDELFLSILSILIGPLSWPVGYIFHGRRNNSSHILIKRRKGK